MVAREGRIFAGVGRRVVISSAADDTWARYRQRSTGSPEACGVLIGWTTETTKVQHIDHVTEPMLGDQRSRYQFELRDPGHQRKVDEAYRQSNSTMIYLGTWHTHPEAKPTPSGLDKSDWRQCLQRNLDRSLVFVIVGTESVRVFVPWGSWFKRLREERL